VSEQEQAVRAIYDSVQDRLACDFAPFAALLKDWQIVPLTQNNIVIGGVMLRNNEIHVGYKRRPSASIMRHIKSTLGDILTRFDAAVTCVMETNTRGLEFCRRLGFVPTLVENGCIYMKCMRCPYV